GAGRRGVGDDAFERFDRGEVGERRDEHLRQLPRRLEVVEGAADLLPRLAEVGQGLPYGRGVPAVTIFLAVAAGRRPGLVRRGSGRAPAVPLAAGQGDG